MDHIVIEGVPPYDGRYPFDLEDQAFNTHEWGWIKRLSGYLPLTIEYTDPEVVTVFACIALKRAGKIEATEVPAVYDRLASAPFGDTITFDGDPAEDDAGPPASSSNGSTDSSGTGSPTSSETSAATPQASGTPALASSALVPDR